MTFANHCGFRKNFPKNEHKCPRHPPQMKWIARTDNNNIWRYQKIHSSRLTADEKDRSAQLTITGKIFGAAFQTFAIMPRCWLGQMTEYIRIDWFCSNFAARDVLYTFGPLFPKVIIDSKRDFNSEEELLEEGCKISACYVACLCQPHCFFVATKPTNQVNWHHGQGLFPFQCMVVQILPTLFSTTSRLWIILDSSAVSIFVDVFIELTVFVNSTNIYLQILRRQCCRDYAGRRKNW